MYLYKLNNINNLNQPIPQQSSKKHYKINTFLNINLLDAPADIVMAAINKLKYFVVYFLPVLHNMH